jgi:hypothetical protein
MDHAGTKRYTPASWTLKQFGGVCAVAKALDMNSSLVSRWGARVPTSRQAAVLEIARERGLDITAEDLIYGREVPQAEPATHG